MRPKVVASLPVRGETDLVKLKTIDSDLIELRLDYARELSFILNSLDYLSQFRDNLIFTIRDPLEGGVNFVDPNTKMKIYKTLVDQGFTCDVEARFLATHWIEPTENTIVSSHFFEKVPKLEEVESNFDPLEKINPLFKVAVVGKSGYKALLSSLLERYGKIAVMPMRVDPLERIAYGLLGSKLIYSSVDEQTAPGQMKYYEVKRILDCMFP